MNGALARRAVDCPHTAGPAEIYACGAVATTKPPMLVSAGHSVHLRWWHVWSAVSSPELPLALAVGSGHQGYWHDVVDRDAAGPAGSGPPAGPGRHTMAPAEQPCSRDHRQSGGAQIQSHGPLSAGVRRVVVGRALADELDPEAALLPHPPPDQPDAFYGCSKSMRQHRITESAAGQIGWKGQPAPDDPIPPPDQAGLIALSVPPLPLVLALEAHPLGVSHSHPHHRPVAAGSQLLAHGRVQLLLNPAGGITALFRRGL